LGLPLLFFTAGSEEASASFFAARFAGVAAFLAPFTSKQVTWSF